MPHLQQISVEHQQVFSMRNLRKRSRLNQWQQTIFLLCECNPSIIATVNRELFSFQPSTLCLSDLQMTNQGNIADKIQKEAISNKECTSTFKAAIEPLLPLVLMLFNHLNGL